MRGRGAGRGVRALVLAAGRGERLRPLSAELPKPLLPVAGRPLVEHTLERLWRAGVEAAAINLHHLGERIRGALGASFRGLPLTYSEEPVLLGTGGALVPLGGFFAGADLVLVVNGDSLCRWPLRALVERHRRERRRGARATLLLHRTVPPAGYGGGVAFEAGRVLAFRPGGHLWRTARTRRVFAGATALEPELVGRLPEGPSDVVAALYEPLLAAGEELAALETARAWHDLGTPRRYLEGALERALERLPERGAWVAEGAAVDATARLRRVAVEAGAEIAAGALVRDTLVLGGARIGAGARVEDAIVAGGVTVAASEEVRGVLLTPDTAGGRVATSLAAGARG